MGSKAELLRACDVVDVSGFEHADFSRDRTSPRIHKQAPLLTESDVVDANGNIMIMHPGPKTHDIDQSLDRFPEQSYLEASAVRDKRAPASSWRVRGAWQEMKVCNQAAVAK